MGEKIVTLNITLKNLQDDILIYRQIVEKKPTKSIDDEISKEIALNILQEMTLGVGYLTICENAGLDVYSPMRSCTNLFKKIGLNSSQIKQIITTYSRILYFDILILPTQNNLKSSREFKDFAINFLKSLSYQEYMKLLKVPTNEISDFILIPDQLQEFFIEVNRSKNIEEIEKNTSVHFDLSKKFMLFLRDAHVIYIGNKGVFLDKDTNQFISFTKV